MSEELGYTCDGCDHWNPCESVWAAAHWDEELVHTCGGCGQKKVIQSGEVICDYEEED